MCIAARPAETNGSRSPKVCRKATATSTCCVRRWRSIRSIRAVCTSAPPAAKCTRRPMPAIVGMPIVRDLPAVLSVEVQTLPESGHDHESYFRRICGRWQRSAARCSSRLRVRSRSARSSTRSRLAIRCCRARSATTSRKQRRAFVRFFACQEDLSHESLDAPLPDGGRIGSRAFSGRGRDRRRYILVPVYALTTRRVVRNVSLISAPILAATACADLKNFSLPNTKITLAESVAAGAFRPPAGDKGGAAAVRRSPGVLPRTGDAHAHQRFRYQDRAVDARRGKLEREISRHRQWRIRRRGQLYPQVRSPTPCAVDTRRPATIPDTKAARTMPSATRKRSRISAIARRTK